MKYLLTVDKHFVDILAQKRFETRNDAATSTPLVDNYQEIGVAGEVAFSQFSGLAMGVWKEKGGDDGIDFIGKLTIDVKTSKKAAYLRVKENKVRAAIYVLCKYYDDSEVELIGWLWGAKVKQYPVEIVGGIRTHQVPATELYPIHKLKYLLSII